MPAEPTCGQELAESAEVPQAVSALFRHVATNLRAHAAWVGTESAVAHAEHAAMLNVAREYEALSAAASRTAELMRNLAALAAAPHDPARFDRIEFVRWMRTKIALQRGLAHLLLSHAAKGERALEQMEL